jgi:predicted butyrate kinase (DUF1464 family)
LGSCRSVRWYQETSLTGTTNLRSIIEEKQRELDKNSKVKEGRDGLMLIVKAGKGASYKTLVDVLDETLINRVKKYAMVKLSPEESAWMQNR